MTSNNIVVNRNTFGGYDLNQSRLSFKLLVYSLELLLQRKSFYNNYLYKIIVIGISKLFMETYQQQFNHFLIEQLLQCVVLMLQIQKRQENCLLIKHSEERKISLGKVRARDLSFGHTSHKQIIEEVEEEVNSDEENKEELSGDSEEEDDEEIVKNKYSIKENIRKELNKNYPSSKPIISYEEDVIDINVDMNSELDKKFVEEMVRMTVSTYKTFDEFSYFKKALLHLKDLFGDFIVNYINKMPESERVVYQSVLKTSRVKVIQEGEVQDSRGRQVSLNDNPEIMQTDLQTEDEVMTVPRRIVKIKKKA
eukprot:CAMPEP_0170536792 /NCGR_PEP_ID=MMETSP0209-20121228/102345_1 /TAXON_ID=665100 ORGANISM="Litonotus pictus, Strain P1" /NCGR_SAMPLE_ID=MMETSP0209 /ASSEMBLY_ACC=CAM_ASM_000301 /LENGTH=308 /DNA_ID=CAMNT_0010838195 /DNA_START=3396 /DNA_END=4318 /DNA_ORIENTATION=+